MKTLRQKYDNLHYETYLRFESLTRKMTQDLILEEYVEIVSIFSESDGGSCA